MRPTVTTLLVIFALSVLASCTSLTKSSQETFATPSAVAHPNDALLEIKAAANVDENLFLLRVLEATYDRWPRDVAEPENLQNWLVQTRTRITYLRATIRANNLDSDIGSGYDDCLKFIDAYETYLANLGVIARQDGKQAQGDSAKALEKAFNVGGGVAKRFIDSGTTTNHSLGVGLAVGLVSAMWEGYQREGARNEAKRSAHEAENRRLNAAWTDTIARAGVLAERLTMRYGWIPGEAGFDGDSNRTIADNLKRRPRDPFTRAAYALLRQENETADHILADAYNLLTTARLVPERRAYDRFRTEFVASAADLAVTAAIRQLNKSAYSSGPSKSSGEAVRFCKTLLALDTADAYGTGNVLLARALGAANRYNEAISAANTAMKKENKWRNDPFFNYRYAKLMSLTNELDLAGDWLNEAYRTGFNQIALVREDADWANFRQGNAQRYYVLTKVQYSWRINYYNFLDDVAFENNSPFELTNVLINVHVKNGSRVWTKNFQIDSFKPGETHTFKDVFSVPNNPSTVATATLTSDQNVP